MCVMGNEDFTVLFNVYLSGTCVTNNVACLISLSDTAQLHTLQGSSRHSSAVSRNLAVQIHANLLPRETRKISRIGRHWSNAKILTLSFKPVLNGISLSAAVSAHCSYF